MSATLSHALMSRSKLPSTACSASMECGGVRTSATLPPRSRRDLAGSAATGSLLREPPARLLFSDDSHRHDDVHIGVQVQVHLMFADGAQRPVRHTHFAALDLEVLTIEGFGDIRRTDRAE